MDSTRLRDKAEATRLLIMAALARRPGIRLADVAQEVGITAQAVSLHLKRLQEDGSVATGREGPRLTPRGRQALHDGARAWREAAAGLAAVVQEVSLVAAEAVTPIRAGDPVVLAMVHGDLVAGKGHEGSSRGTAVCDARPGEEVLVQDPEGVVDLHPAPLEVVVLPGPAEGGTRGTDSAGPLPQDALVAALGTSAMLAARRMEGRVDLRFAAVPAAFNAAERGVPVRLYVTRDRLAEAQRHLERLQQETLHRVPVTQRDAPIEQ